MMNAEAKPGNGNGVIDFFRDSRRKGALSFLEEGQIPG